MNRKSEHLLKYSIIALLFPIVLFAQEPILNKTSVPGSDTVAIRFSQLIRASEMKENLTVLASDDYEGRETGKEGQKKAANYIQAWLSKSGIPPYKDNTYYQTYPLNMFMPVPAEVSIGGKKYTGNKDYYNFPGVSEQRIETDEVTFLGYGIEEEQYNDYKNADVNGKVIMVLAGEPYNNEGLSLITGTRQPSLWTTYWKVRTEKARDMGAKALLIIVDDIAKGIEDNRHKLETPSLKLDQQLPGQEMPVIFISKEMANAILKKETVDHLVQKISKKGKPLKKQLTTQVIIDVKNSSEKIEAENVLGFVEGSDLKNEVLVITAHYDHLGKEGNVVFNGADDDGSGTVAVMQLAKAFAYAKKAGHGPRRSMLFMTVSGEEKGLLGSSYYASHPVYPLENTVCDLNIDMIGRIDEKHGTDPDYIYLIGSDKLSSELHNISEKTNKIYTKLALDYTYNDEKDRNRYYYRSDHYNFAKKGIPVIFYFNGVHADYHKETDEVEKIDFNKMEKIARLVFFTAWEIANRNDRLKVDSNKK